jgi:hypothetical protein
MIVEMKKNAIRLSRMHRQSEALTVSFLRAG